MISTRVYLLLLATALFSGCGTGSSSSVADPYASAPYRGLTNGTTVASLSAAANVIPLTVDGSTCSSTTNSPYMNEPCISVKICQHGSTTVCQTINDVLLDTGSYGLRVFKSVLNTSLQSGLTYMTSGGSTIAECAAYGDGSADWGPLAEADVYLGGEPAVEAPIQIIDSTYATVPSGCGSPDTDPASTGYQAILGVGVFSSDCGSGCAIDSNNKMYYGCSGSTCTGAALATSLQVTNPISLLPTDSNGLILELPQVPSGGVSSVSGYLVLGIGTESNNDPPSDVVTFPADTDYGEFQTYFNGNNYTGFIDSGSNGLYFPAPSNLPSCGDAASFFCPGSDQSLVGTTIGSSGSPAYNVSFTIGDFDSFPASSLVLSDVGGSSGGGLLNGMFDWGLPFYLGRNVYEGIDGVSSSLGTGPYWAY